jgi:hypothetical protein
MVPRELYERAGLYSPTFGFVADVEMWIRLALIGDVGYIAEPLIQVREREPGHQYFEQRWDIIERLIEIFRVYDKRVSASHGWGAIRLEARIERYLLRTYLSVLMRGSRRERQRAGAFLKQSPTLLCRALGALVSD